jgi:hypothetical protein
MHNRLNVKALQVSNYFINKPFADQLIENAKQYQVLRHSRRQILNQRTVVLFLTAYQLEHYHMNCATMPQNEIN